MVAIIGVFQFLKFSAFGAIAMAKSKLTWVLAALFALAYLMVFGVILAASQTGPGTDPRATAGMIKMFMFGKSFILPFFGLVLWGRVMLFVYIRPFRQARDWVRAQVAQQTPTDAPFHEDASVVRIGQGA